MADIITIGDGMVTMDPATKGPMRFVNSFVRKVGGAELNFAVGCARLGLDVGWISRLGKDEFGRVVKKFMASEGVDMSQVKFVNDYPTALNFKEILEDGSARIFYYRQGTATTTMTPDDLNPDYFKQAKLLHITGVFPAIAEHYIPIMQRALELAKEHNLLVSFDPNIRLRLWKSKEAAREVLTSFLPYVDIVLTGIDEAELLLGTNEPKKIVERFYQYGAGYVSIKKGKDGSVGAYGSEYIESPPVKERKVVDTVGAGDGYDAGFIYGVMNGWSLERTLKFANTIGAMVVSVTGDNEGLPYYEDVLMYMGEMEYIER
ncbi:sugar kinase [Petroclostridium sp. X23]|uniref:sugar kinase n=1 Tax=Petroclostridium sp. X23 TaxID=3045146 RepID=UPI0024AE3F63|nr:sugar kinase [Petroclostridium sp. X23]WHH59232.1 sugar kinase [Petroclostridium sp. X23]